MNSNKVLELVKQIPKGKISTYKIISHRLNSKAYRAIGQILKKNPFAPKVPCHRVIKSDGFVGQYSKGINAKIKLLKSEGIYINKYKKINLKKYLFRFK